MRPSKLSCSSTVQHSGDGPRSRAALPGLGARKSTHTPSGKRKTGDPRVSRLPFELCPSIEGLYLLDLGGEGFDLQVATAAALPDLEPEEHIGEIHAGTDAV